MNEAVSTEAAPAVRIAPGAPLTDLLWLVLPLAVLALAVAWLIVGRSAAELQQRRAAGREPDLRAHHPRRRRASTSWSAPAAPSR